MVPDAEQLARIGGDQIGVLAACAAHGCEKPAVRVRSGLADLAVAGVLVLGSPDAAALRPGVSLDEARIAEERRGVRGAGAFRSGAPLARRGMPGVG